MKSKVPPQSFVAAEKKSSLFLAKICLLLAPLLLATQAGGAVIIWDATPTTVIPSDVSQVSNTGTLVLAEFMGTDSAATVDINGVHFVNFQVATNVTNARGANGGNYLADPSGPYENLLNGAMYNTSNPVPIVVSNLVSGTTYQIQIWTPYWALNNFPTAYSSSAIMGDPSQSAYLQCGITTYPEGVVVTQPQFIMGTFTADGTSQNIYYYSSAGLGMVAALQVRAVPEPQSWALAALGASAIFFRLRRKLRV